MAIGVTYEKFMGSCPKELEPYDKAYTIKKNHEDISNWQLGQYIAAAISCVFPKGKYPDKPAFQIEIKKESGFKESKEEIAVFEMKQRIELLRESGLPESPV